MRDIDCSLRSLLVSCALAGALFIPSAALAAGVSPLDASPAQRKEATDHFAIGKRALESQNWEKAISELRASLDVVDSPNARLELARALRDSDDLGDAWVEYWRSAESATRLAQKEERYAKTAEAATNEREDLARRLAFIEVTVPHAPADVTLSVGGKVVASEDWGAPVVVVPGAVDIVLANGKGAELARRSVNAAIGQTTAVSLDVQPPPETALAGRPAIEPSEQEKPAADEGAAQPEQIAAPPSNRTKLRPFAYAVAGVGVAGLATFAVFGLLSNSTYDDLKNACPHGCPPDKRSEIDRGILEQTIANVGLVVGLVGVAAGTTMFFLSSPSGSQGAGTALVVAPGYLGVRGTL